MWGLLLGVLFLLVFILGALLGGLAFIHFLPWYKAMRKLYRKAWDATTLMLKNREMLWVLFDGPPSHESGRFVEVVNTDGDSVGLLGGDHGWIQHDDGLWALGPFVDAGSRL